ncbi:SCO3374 family protein [Streptomyces sp. NPDC005930]|uniref:SCO3374 family protein n=1 Tax=Streptomyces sp. NPDC005930 TaxID=3364736 RepID=UPI00367E0079
MVGAPHPVPVAAAAPVVPSPRRPTGVGGPAGERTRWWYESVLGWPTVPGDPVRLRTGIRFDVLDVPARAGYATLERLGRSGRTPPGFPVALRGGRMLLLVAAGGADELPGLLEWLEWGSLAPALDLTAVGAGGLVEAPLVPDPGPDGPRGSSGPCGSHEGRHGSTRPCGSPEGSTAGAAGPVGSQEGRPVGSTGSLASQEGPSRSAGSAHLPSRPPDRDGLRGAAVWLRPPKPGCEVEPSLPALSALGCAGTAPDLARLVHTLATQCHRVRLTADVPPRARPVARVG